ncbi:MAG: hypothetical protein KDB14_34070 [Planctomycetales bacterium]|nr:hypothetical protein [Planctomycetales bacterium]
MAVVIGTDEAGYGPNLGPLLIAATAWRVPDPELDLFERLAAAVSDTPKSAAAVTIADSKELYKPQGGLARLEQGLLPALRMLGELPRCWDDIWSSLAPRSANHLNALPWHSQYMAAIPRSADADDIEHRASAFRETLRDADVQLLGIACRAVFPQEFNDLVDACGSKGELLSDATLQLVAEQLELAGDEPVLVQCDKHGGRNRYSPLLQRQFPEYLVEIVAEGRGQSIYRWGPASRRVEIRFTAKGERFLPAALASMACKYLRELAMEAFNDYWRQRISGLKPTAGYPVDAKRFRADIAATQQELKIDDRLLWRCR